MRRFLKRWWLVAAAIALLIAAATDRVPFSSMCFQPNQSARAMCYQQYASTALMMKLSVLPLIDAARLERDKPRILSEYRRALSQGMLPSDGPSPHDLEQMIDSIINDKLGTPI